MIERLSIMKESVRACDINQLMKDESLIELEKVKEEKLKLRKLA